VLLDIDNCQNIEMSKQLYKKTAIGKSKVCDSFGLFAMENINYNEFICEYIGEIISNEESDRRFLIYNELEIFYLFKINTEYHIDSYTIGSEMRYIIFIYLLVFVYLFTNCIDMLVIRVMD